MDDSIVQLVGAPLMNTLTPEILVSVDVGCHSHSVEIGLRDGKKWGQVFDLSERNGGQVFDL